MLEGATFYVLFATFAFARARHLELFRSAQQQLDVGAGGTAFVALKLMEYADKAARGTGLSTNLFFDFYFILTGFHLLQVVAGLLGPGADGCGTDAPDARRAKAHAERNKTP